MAIKIEGREIDGILIDGDGTLYSEALLDTIFEPVRIKLATRLWQRRNIDSPSQTQILEMRNNFMERAKELGSFTYAYEVLGGTAEEYEDIAESNDRSVHLSPDPELKSFLQSLKGQVKLAVLTATIEATNALTCDKLFGSDWLLLFDAVICRDTLGVGAKKPDVAAFMYTLDLLQVTPKRAAMIGDSGNSDLKPVEELGVYKIKVGKNNYPKADLHLNSIHELKLHLGR